MRTSSDNSSPQRSRGGCERCRRRRQKCGEERPSCSRCLAAHSLCSYKPLHIRWGGRDFNQSRFGNCRVHKIETDPDSFVYTANSAWRRCMSSSGPIRLPIHIPGPPESSEPPEPPEFAHEHHPKHASSLVRTPAPSPDLAPDLRMLLDDFICKGSAAISTHRRVQEETCRALVPVALEARALLHAIVAFSAAQGAARFEVGGLAYTRLKAQEALSRTICIQSLRDEINGINLNMTSPDMPCKPHALRAGVVVATSLMLCTGALFSDADDYNAWRIYLQGARAALPTALASSGASSYVAGEDTLTLYLRQRYTMLETLALLSDGGFEALDPSHDRTVTRSHSLLSQGRPPFLRSAASTLSNHAGCGTGIVNMLRTIGSVAWERRNPSLLLSEADFVCEAELLDAALQATIQRDHDSPPALRTTTAGDAIATFDPTYHEFAACNEIFAHMARLYVRTKIRGAPASDSIVQMLVQTIIRGAAQLDLRPGGLSPVIGLNTALSVAGEYAAAAEDRAAILTLLQALYNATHNHNLMVTMRSLEAGWAAASLPKRAQMAQKCDSCTPHYFSPSLASSATNGDHDFIPY